MYSYGMFVRVRKQPGKDRLIPYAYLVENHWNPFRRKNEQKIVASLGRVEHLPTDGTIEKMITALDTFATKMGFASLSCGIVLPDLSDESLLDATVDYGSLLLATHILHMLSLDTIITTLAGADTTKKVSQEKILPIVTALLAHRLANRTDASERSTYQWYTTKVFHQHQPQLTDEDFYRTLDVLLAHKDAIEQGYYERNRDLFNGELDLVLFDTTSIYYWGWQEDGKRYTPQDLLQYGFSKDGKGNLKQVIVGVLMTTDGVPIAHEVFAGNTADVTSFATMVTTIKQKYNLKKVVLIADRGMVSQENLVKLESMGLTYIVGVRMRKLPPLLKQRLITSIEQEDMEKGTDNLYTKEFPLAKLSEEELQELVKPILTGKTTTFTAETIRDFVAKRRFFVCLNPYVKEATKGKREYFKTIIRNKIAHMPTKEWVVKNGYKKYLKFEKGLEPTLDDEKLQGEEVYDGKWVIMTNDQHLTAYVAGLYYKSLQVIERGFRDLKSLITVQPIYHFKEERIKAHIFVCFLSLIMKWSVCRVINKHSQETGRRFIEDMDNLKAIAVDKQLSLYVRTTISTTMQEAMKKLKMTIPPKVILDSRRKVNAPIGPKGGRPRRDRSRNQLLLPNV